MRIQNCVFFKIGFFFKIASNSPSYLSLGISWNIRILKFNIKTAQKSGYTDWTNIALYCASEVFTSNPSTFHFSGPAIGGHERVYGVPICRTSFSQCSLPTVDTVSIKLQWQILCYSIWRCGDRNPANRIAGKQAAVMARIRLKMELTTKNGFL